MGYGKFQNQVILITGGAGDLGRGLAKEFLQLGAAVFVCDRDKAAIERIGKDYQEENIVTEELDVAVPEQIRDFVARIAAKENRIDVLINAAGYCPICSLEAMQEEMWDEIVDSSLKGTFFASQAVMKPMKENRYGRIINVSSIGAYNGGAVATAAYSAAKAGIIALSKSFATQLSPFGITVNNVAPGPFDSRMISDFPPDTMGKIIASTPTRRIGKAEDVVHAVRFLADRASSHITGATIDINGGLYMR